MSYELIITEKPDAAKKIAEALATGKPIKENLNGVPIYKITHGKQDIVVGCAVGHLFTVAEKEKGKWTYPIYDIEWVESSEAHKGADFTKKYVNALKKISKDAKDFTVATDYDIEGEVIGLNVIKYICKQKDANRMKFSTLTKEDLIESYTNKQKHIDWGQANAGVTRHELDWIYGINLSRALSLAIKNATKKFKLLSAGRVQGPALKIIVEKEKEISNFKPVPYWEIRLNGKIKKEDIEAIHKEDKIWEKTRAEEIIKKTKNAKKGKVANIDKKEFEQKPPVPFDLTSLQIEAHKTLRISPKQTLEIAQSLYLEGAISYPRTSSQKLPKTIGYEKILKELSKQTEFKKECGMILSKKNLVPNEGNKTDDAHPAIYPTGIQTHITDPRALQLYYLIVRRFLSVFGDPAKRQTITIEIDVNNEIFITKGTTTIVKGWFEFYGKFVMLEEKELPKVEKGEDVDIKTIEMLDKETQPPKRYTEASIIKELERRNLGTKATRAAIVDNLFSRGYVHEKSIQATELGIRTCDILDKYCPEILDEKLTRDFEDEMEDIRKTKKTHDQIISKAETVLTKILTQFKKNEKNIGEELYKATIETRDELSRIGKCPNCKEGELHLRIGKFGQFVACNQYPKCNTTFSIPRVTIKKTDKICEVCGSPMILVIKSKKKPQELCLNKNCSSKKIGEDSEHKQEVKEMEAGLITRQCPKCKEGELVVRKSIYGEFFGCNKYPKCRYTERIQQTPAILKEDFEKNNHEKIKDTKKPKNKKVNKDKA